jgi:ATP synthase protein I
MSKPQDTEGLPESAKGVTGDLASRIASAKRERQREEHKASGGGSDNSGMARGLRLGSEFAAAILVGTGIGYVVDLGLGTSPWGLLIMLLVGFAAGVLNVIRAVTEMNAEAQASPVPGTGPDGDRHRPDDL